MLEIVQKKTALAKGCCLFDMPSSSFQRWIWACARLEKISRKILRNTNDNLMI